MTGQTHFHISRNSVDGNLLCSKRHAVATDALSCIWRTFCCIKNKKQISSFDTRLCAFKRANEAAQRGLIPTINKQMPDLWRGFSRRLWVRWEDICSGRCYVYPKTVAPETLRHRLLGLALLWSSGSVVLLCMTYIEMWSRPDLM